MRALGLGLGLPFGGRAAGGGAPADPTLALDLDLLAGTLDPRVTFTRAGTATYTGSSGVMQTAAVDVPRFDYDPVTLAARGLLLDGQRTNLEPRSSISGASGVWTINGPATGTANSQVAPDGTTTAARLVASSTALAQRGLLLPAVSLASSTAYTGSFYVKQNGSHNAFLQVNRGSASAVAYFDLTAGTALVGADLVAGFTNKSAVIQNCGNGWYRCSFTLTTPGSGTTGQQYFGICGAFDATGDDRSSVGVVGEGIDLWGAQLEAGAFASSYIPTTTVAVTRPADVATLTGSNFSSWYNASQGTFVLDFEQPAAGLGGWLLIVNNGTDTFRMGLGSGGDVLIVNSSIQLNVSAGVIPATPSKMAIAYLLNNSGGALNGVAIATDTACTIPSVIDRLIINNGIAAIPPVPMRYRRVRFYNVRKSNADLATLTTP